MDANIGVALWRAFAGSHWLWEGVATSLILFVVARLVVFGYREHSYLYQIESGARMLDVWLEVCLPLVRRLRLPRYRAHLRVLLSRSGMRKDWSVDHFIASQLLYAGIVATFSLVLLKIVLGLSLVWVLLAVLLAVSLPYLKLSDLAASRYASCNRDLPFVLDYLSLAMGAGLDFNQGLRVVVQDAPASPLLDEFGLVLRNIRLGMSRAEALAEMDRRLSSPSVHQFVQALVQGMELGTDVVAALRASSTRLQETRFQLAEERAGKISVRMMIPMMCFVIPSVMIVLFGPMLLAYIQQG